MDNKSSNLRDSELVANLDWVQRLALSLARDRDAADDLTQDVARLWLEKRPALADGPRGWLASVARKLALDRARSEVSRKAREHSASRPEGESFEVVERGARQRRVVEAVMQLAEPYRSTILYRYLDGLETREVAERMGVPEATVRKRVERGLALLRERLDREFGSRSDAWAIALLEPGLRSAVFKGVGLMSIKWLAAAGVVVLLAGGTWYVRGRTGPVVEAVGGTGLVVSDEIAAAREKQPLVDRLTRADETQRTAVQAAPVSAQNMPGLRGFIFVDDIHIAPAGLKITRKRDGNQPKVDAQVDAATASWSLETLGGPPGRLWITSNSTVPALIPVPSDLWESGGVLDLHLSKGRTLTLTILDRATKQPLPFLAFQLSRMIELERAHGRVLTDGTETTHRTDAQGKALLTGVPLTGFVRVTVSLATNGNPDWSTWLRQDEPGDLEQTLLVSPPLGQGCAGGQVPAWAVALTDGAKSVRVVSRDTTYETPQGRGTPFPLAQDGFGHFELCASAPSTHAVWLERADDGARLSAETELTFAQPGPQDPISFREVQGRKVTLAFINVPERGELRAWVVGKTSMAHRVTQSCKGSAFSREFTLTEDQQIQLSLRLRENTHEKSDWTRLVKLADEREITVDLGGSERNVRFECPESGTLAENGFISLMRCEGGQVCMEQFVAVICTSGRGENSVLVPNGRWLYSYSDNNQPAIWGVVDVKSATEPGEELVLRPRVRLAPVEEFGAGVRFDEIDGVSLAKLPEQGRALKLKGRGARIVVPIDAKYTALEEKK